MANKKNIALWVKTLRETQTPQGKHALTITDTKGDIVAQCCLGVACELALANGVELEVKQDTSDLGDELDVPIRTYDGFNGWLPRKVYEWLDLYESNPMLARNSHNVIITCSAANDELGYGFHKIADLIEKAYLTTKED
jgi:hypothetical protein